MPLPLPLRIKVGSFTKRTSTGIQAVTGVGFRPSAVLLFSVGNTSTGAWEGTGTQADATGLALAFGDKQGGIARNVGTLKIAFAVA